MNARVSKVFPFPANAYSRYLKFRVWVATKARRCRKNKRLLHCAIGGGEKITKTGEGADARLFFTLDRRRSLEHAACPNARKERLARAADLLYVPTTLAASPSWRKFRYIPTHPGRGLLRVSNVTGEVMRLTLSFRISSSVRKPKPISSTAWRITVLS